MAIQTSLGKAFEYACLNSLNSELSDQQEVILEDTSALNVARDFYNGADEKTKEKMDLAANAAVRVILRLEPQLQNPLKNNPLYLTIQEDAAGISGDVRDVLCIRRQNEWEIGLSCKHNHSAVKHSRLSPSIDFGQMWFGIPCSNEYFEEITPMFDELRELKSKKVLWREIENKEERYYIPLLKAFMKELKRLDSENPNIIPKRLLSYLLGLNDFYKVITDDKRKVTKVQVYSLYGTLNRAAGRIRPQVKIPQLVMPERFFNIDFKPSSGNTVHVVCDGGWTISMRIHNASSKVEPSLKFDVNLLGVPPTLYTHHEPWE
ncbi:HaeIII family restriction endonuclease [Clostridium sp. C2-6-12]|uniref:HaeIII family restriction endonuclease n=1 Tax=Clostridium sp. C2-6-12 TaxID=2698832 RepID=UPI00136D96F3|nr:HaeIII family restriction endonuclease [Clostridium sp. C2-6-12]